LARVLPPTMADSDHSAQERTLEPSADDWRKHGAKEGAALAPSRPSAPARGAALALFMLGDPLLADLRAVLARGLAFDAATVRDPARMTARFGELAAHGLLAVAPVLVILLAAAFAAPLAVGGWLFSPQLAAPRLDRMSPAKASAACCRSRPCPNSARCCW